MRCSSSQVIASEQSRSLTVWRAASARWSPRSGLPRDGEEVRIVVVAEGGEPPTAPRCCRRRRGRRRRPRGAAQAEQRGGPRNASAAPFPLYGDGPKPSMRPPRVTYRPLGINSGLDELESRSSVSRRCEQIKGVPEHSRPTAATPSRQSRTIRERLWPAQTSRDPEAIKPVANPRARDCTQTPDRPERTPVQAKTRNTRAVPRRPNRPRAGSPQPDTTPTHAASHSRHRQEPWDSK